MTSRTSFLFSFCSFFCNVLIFSVLPTHLGCEPSHWERLGKEVSAISDVSPLRLPLVSEFLAA